MGVVQAKEWKATVLAGFAGREAFLNQRRCLVWAGLDTTFSYLIGNFTGLPAEQFLLAAVIGTVCYISWRYLEALFGSDGPPWPLSTLHMAGLHAKARESHAFIRLSPVGGLTGSGRLSLGALSRSLKLQQRSGQNTEHHHCFLSFLYCEHVSDHVPQALREL